MDKFSFLACTLAGALSLPVPAHSESTRIEVYPLSQKFVDVEYGDTLGGIAAALLPHNPGLQQRLMQDIMRMNPQAFPDDHADRMLAGRRLWLPNTMQQADDLTGDGDVVVESFSWGNVKRPRP